MKPLRNSANTALIVIILVVLGCSCPKAKESPEQPDAASPAQKTTNETEKEIADKSSAQSQNNRDEMISIEKYNRIAFGMTYLEVTEIIGSDGQIIKTSPEGMVRYLWGDDQRFMMISFMNDRVDFKSQNGLD